VAMFIFVTVLNMEPDRKEDVGGSKKLNVVDSSRGHLSCEAM